MTSARVGVSEKQARFCEEYIIDLNGAAAAVRAGYAEKAAKEQASRLLTIANVQNYIQELQKARSERTEITADMVIQELALIAFADVSEYKSDDRGDVWTSGKSSMRAVSSIKRKTRSYGEGKTETEVEIKLWNKNDALKQLGMHLGVFEKDNQQKRPSTEYVFPDDIKPDEQP